MGADALASRSEAERLELTFQTVVRIRIAGGAQFSASGQMQGIGLIRKAGKVNNSLNANLMGQAMKDTLRGAGLHEVIPLYRTAAHHLIPTQVAEEFEDFFKAIGYQHNHPPNGVWMRAEQEALYRDALDAGWHSGNHPGYSQAMEDKIGEISAKFFNDFKSPGATNVGKSQAISKARKAIAVLQNEARKNLTAEQIPIVAKGSGMEQSNLKVLWDSVLQQINY